MADHAEAAVEYSVDFGEGDQRSMSVRDIAKAYADGTITGDTYVWTDGFADWKPLSEIPELLEAVQTSAARAPKPSPWDARGAQRAAARASSSRSPTADLFGGIETAGSEDEVATSAPDQHHGNSHGGSSSSTTGARNESSVLFSLSALTSAANARPSNRPTSSASRDDSGLIDLKALTAAAMKSDTGASAPIAPAIPVAPLAPLGAPPLGLAAPLGGGITATTDIGVGYPQQKSKAPLYIGGGIAVGMIALAAAIALRPAPPPPPAPIVVAAPPPPVAPTPPPAAAPTQEAKAPATAGAEEAAPPKTAPAPQANNRSIRRSPPSTGAATPKKSEESTAKPAATPPPKKSSGGCGCAGGDLQCAMRCAAKGG